MAASGWTRYNNSRFGTEMSYPNSHFQPAGEPPANNDGRSFASGDGQAQVLVWAGHNALDQTAQQMLDDIHTNNAGAQVLSQHVTAQGFTVKLQTGAKILHQRSLMGADNVVHNLRLLYPAAAEDTYAPVAQEVIASLSSATASQQSATESATAPATAPATDMEQAFWSSVQNSPQVAGLEAYLEQFPNGAYAGEARQRIAELSTPEPQADPQLELAFWQSIQNASDPAMFQAYLDQWPNGTFAVLARLKLQQLQAAPAAGSEMGARRRLAIC